MVRKNTCSLAFIWYKIRSEKSSISSEHTHTQTKRSNYKFVNGGLNVFQWKDAVLSRKQTVLGFIRFGHISSIKQVTDIKQLELLVYKATSIFYE